MRTKYIITTIVALLIYYMATYYVGWRIYDTIQALLHTSAVTAYWVTYAALSTSYILGRVGQMFYPSLISNSLIVIGAYWFGLFFYLLLLWSIVDIASYIYTFLMGIPILHPNSTTGWIIILISGIVFLWGIWNARNPRINHYSLRVNKYCHMPNLHIVAVSDTHFGLLVGKNRLDRLVADIHRLNPDIILWPGDILDENVGTFLDNDMDKALQRIKPPLGMYACLGSHEYIWGYPNKAISALSKAGITVLQDQVIKVANSFYLAGRDDFFRMRLTDCPRKNLTNILEECDFSLPIILLDHYPARLAEALENGVDLQLSGHTHSGQLFPLNLITRFLFELDAGYRRTGSFHVIVSSGYGTWLLPLRVGTTAEILSIQVAFLNPRRD